MNTSYPAFLLFHNWTNCFGYTRNLADLAGLRTPTLSIRPTTAALLGYFRVRSCDDPHLTFYIQIFGSLPFSHVYVNSVFANLCGFEENQEVILEKINVASCTSVEIAPLTANDFEILDKSSSHVEEAFLDQIHIVYPKMQFPFWISHGVYASFRIESISPATDQAVYLGPSTELHIVPITNGSLSMSRTEKKSSENIVEVHRPDHCIMFNKNYEDYTRISCSSIDRKMIYILKLVDISLTKSDSDWIFGENKEQELLSNLAQFVAVYPLLFSVNGIVFYVPLPERGVTVKILPSTLDLNDVHYSLSKICFIVNSQCHFNIQKEPFQIEQEHEYVDVHNFGITDTKSFLHLEYQSHYLRELSNWIEYTDREEWIGHALLLGAEGSGKSVIASRLARRLAKSSRCWFSLKIDCSTWKGKQSENIEKSLVFQMKKLQQRSPSFLILDDIDFLSIESEDEHRQVGVERIFYMLWRVLSSCDVPVLATAKKLHNIHKSLVLESGKRLFGFTRELSNLSQNERLEILREFLEPDCDLTPASKATENFTIADLRKFATRIQIEAKIRASPLSNDIIEIALSHSRPLGHVILKPKDEKKLSLIDIGGMKTEKQLLLEVIIWPFKYAELYSRCGVRLGKGVLLYGQSGCGKTLLANAVAEHSKFNIISVKGPELLSKYIGSSEENIRGVFERARSSAPCVVIFDELDSLAPRRGSDSTGVTDRVVNQLLTEMDGAEVLSGVFVIGCSSRIDLIDPALLRPGRFDHLVKCIPPNEADRREILEIILRNVRINADVSINDLASRTSGWTGANLKALITNAHFEAKRNKPDDIAEDDVLLSIKDIYSVFEDSKPKEHKHQKEAFRAGQRVTLA